MPASLSARFFCTFRCLPEKNSTELSEKHQGGCSLLKTKSKVKKIVGRFKQELKKLGINSKEIILYDSYAKGTSQEGSDTALIVISDDFKNLNLREGLEILGLAAGRVFEPIEVLGYTKKEIKGKKECFVEEILNSAPSRV